MRTRITWLPMLYASQQIEIVLSFQLIRFKMYIWIGLDWIGLDLEDSDTILMFLLLRLRELYLSYAKIFV